VKTPAYLSKIGKGMLLTNFFRGLSDKLTPNTVSKRRRTIAARIDKIFNSTIAYGPFRGMKLLKNPRWSIGDKASMMLCFYEKEVLDSLQRVPASYRTFIDLGAADGYYAVGVLVNNMFDRSYAFEISEEGQNLIRQNAAENGVADRIVVGGIADKNFYNALSQDAQRSAVILVDIEGGEFDLLDRDVFSALKDAIFIVELHDWFFDDGAARLQKLKDAAQKTHAVSAFSTGSRDPSQIKELWPFHDIDRWLLCSEGRKRLMTWLRLDPLQAE